MRWACAKRFGLGKTTAGKGSCLNQEVDLDGTMELSTKKAARSPAISSALQLSLGRHSGLDEGRRRFFVQCAPRLDKTGAGRLRRRQQANHSQCRRQDRMVRRQAQAQGRGEDCSSSRHKQLRVTGVSEGLCRCKRVACGEGKLFSSLLNWDISRTHHASQSELLSK